MALSLAPYNRVITILGGGDAGRRRISNVTHLAAQSVAVAFSLRILIPLVFTILNGPTLGFYFPLSTMLFMFLAGPFLVFPLLIVLQAPVVVLSGLLNYALGHQHEDERRRTYLIPSWITAFVFAVLLSVLFSLCD